MRGEARMYHKEFSPDMRLAAYIRSYFFISVNFGKFHFPADGCPGLIVNLGNPFLLGFEQGRLSEFVGCRFFGSQTRNLLVTHVKGQTELLAVKFKPGQWTRFFNVPAIELTDTSASIHTLWGKSGRELEQRVYETKHVSNKVKLLDHTFIKLLSIGNDASDERIPMALNAIWRHNGQVRIEELAKALSISRRHLNRCFLEFVGLTPKRVCRIARFLSAFSPRQTIGQINWADLAIASGYSDQAHFIRECRYFTGKSPLPFLNDRTSLEQAVTGRTDIMSHFFNTPDVSSDTPAI
jgi:AraC-like DNA-binding protein